MFDDFVFHPSEDESDWKVDGTDDKNCDEDVGSACTDNVNCDNQYYHIFVDPQQTVAGYKYLLIVLY